MGAIHTFVVLAYKESKYLEDCIKSVLSQTVPSEVVVATSTPNDYIKKIANKYSLDILVRKNEKKGIGYDFEFARKCVSTSLVTIAHQDDIYDKNYLESVLKEYEEHNDALIVFSDYYEIHGDKKIYTSNNLKIKRLLLSPLKNSKLNKHKLFKRFSLRLGNAICCPAVTFVNSNINVSSLFLAPMRSNVDWYAWELLSKEKGRFVFVDKCLMGHRIHENSETSKTIQDDVRTEEDLIMLKKFWPEFLARIVNRVYKNSEKGNE